VRLIISRLVFSWKDWVDAVRRKCVLFRIHAPESKGLRELKRGDALTKL
jgi:hypothetical protein